MKWVTRERPKIDRLTCPWLIRRFIDEQAEILYVSAGHVRLMAEQTGAIPFDIPDVELGHAGDHCSFDAFIEKYGLGDPALEHLALIVRAADTDTLEQAREAAGLLATTLGLSANIPMTNAFSKRPCPCTTRSTPGAARSPADMYNPQA